MQAVRCEACGHKALVAASQCPLCGHLFDLRDSFGELLPLAHCESCGCDYPRRDGACKWCGTTPAPRRVTGAVVLKAGGALAFVGMAIGVWATRDAAEESPVPDERGRVAALVNAPRLVTPKSEAFTPAVVSRDTSSTRTLDALSPGTRDTSSAGALEVSSARMPSTGAPDTTSATALDAIPRARPATAAAAEPSLRATPVPSAPAGDTAAPAPAAPLPVRPATPSRAARSGVAARAPTAAPRTSARTPARRSTTRWRSVVARDWLIVRAAPARTARLLGSLGPDTRIQLGESRAGWVRVRIRGLAGWVDESRLLARGAP